MFVSTLPNEQANEQANEHKKSQTAFENLRFLRIETD
jgi:hypothetical protein